MASEAEWRNPADRLDAELFHACSDREAYGDMYRFAKNAHLQIRDLNNDLVVAKAKITRLETELDEAKAVIKSLTTKHPGDDAPF